MLYNKLNTEVYQSITYGKLDTNGYLMSSQRKQDDTWSPLSEFEGGGQTADYFNEDKTVDTYKEAKEAKKKKFVVDMMAIDTIEVMYEGNMYAGSREAQINLASTITKLKNKTKTTKWYTVDRQKLDLTREQLEEILDLIDIEHDLIMEA